MARKSPAQDASKFKLFTEPLWKLQATAIKGLMKVAGAGLLRCDLRPGSQCVLLPQRAGHQNLVCSVLDLLASRKAASRCQTLEHIYMDIYFESSIEPVRIYWSIDSAAILCMLEAAGDGIAAAGREV